MSVAVDVACTLALVALIALSAVRFEATWRAIGSPDVARAALARTGRPLARGLIAAGVTANSITGASLALAAVAAMLAAAGHFGAAALSLGVASVGDALDGLVARESDTVSRAGALFDATADRYGELLFLGGVAFAVRDRGAVLVLVLLAILGSVMVSYGSAKAEALGAEVPGGAMRRAARAITMVAGAALTPVWTVASARLALPGWTADAPLVVALLVLGVVANASAVVRLRAIGRAVSPLPVAVPAPRRALREPEATLDAAE